MEQNNQKLNLVKILKDCPAGTKLYSPIWGDVTLLRVYEENLTTHPIWVKVERHLGSASFTKEGKWSNDENAECLLFPSKENRDWEAFTFTGESSETDNTEDLQDMVRQLNKRCKEAILIGMAYSKYVAITLFRDVPVSVKEKMLHDFLECKGIKEIREVYDKYNRLTLNGEYGNFD